MHTPATNPAETLAEELDAGHALLQVLQNEQELLINADVEGLSKATEEKARLVTRMNELALRRHRSLGTAGFEASETGMQAWLKNGKSAQQVEQDWTKLIELARSARELNRTNGLLIGQHMARTQHTLNVLQGVQQSEQLYGPDGQATGAGSGRRLVVG